jgi:hypothetical protein
MKRITALIVLLLFSNTMHSQSLEGTWTGCFTDDRDQVADMRYTYVLVFSQKNDTVYDAVSVTYTKQFHQKDTISCLMKGWSLNSDVVHLEETAIVKSPLTANEQCFQKWN